MICLAPSWKPRTSEVRLQEREILGVQERTFPHSIMGELCNVKKKKEPVIIMICLAPSWKLRASEARMQEKEILGAQERIYPHSILGELSNEKKKGEPACNNHDMFSAIMEAADQRGPDAGEGDPRGAGADLSAQHHG